MHKWSKNVKKKGWKRGKLVIENNNLLITAENWKEFLAEIAVAPFVGAWIETACTLKYGMTGSGRSLRGSVDWNSRVPDHLLFYLRRSLRGSVDWNSNKHTRMMPVHSRSLRGSVDWNQSPGQSVTWWMSRSLRGSVDWNCDRRTNRCRKCVAPFVGAWIETWNTAGLWQ